jgi:hypothetical protein
LSRFSFFDTCFSGLKTSFAATSGPACPHICGNKTNMKNLISFLLLSFLLSSCALTSRTTIGPQKGFELGDGTHGAFTAMVRNDCSVAVEIYKMPLGGTIQKIATLQPGQQKKVRIDADTKAIFKNISNEEAAVKLKVTGDTGLSIGGPNY